MDKIIIEIGFLICLVLFLLIIIYGLYQQIIELQNKINSKFDIKNVVIFEHIYQPITLKKVTRISETLHDDNEEYKSFIKKRIIDESFHELLNNIKDNDLFEITEREIGRDKEIEIKLYLYKKQC